MMTTHPDKKIAPPDQRKRSGQLHDSIEPASLTLAEAQGIAESIVGPIEWRGAEGYCACPGIGLHTKPNAEIDCKATCEKIGTLPPGVYCFHGSCQAACDTASHALRSALGRRAPSPSSRNHAPFIMPTRPAKPEFSPEKLERIARKLDGADAEWFAARSPKQPDNRTPASFLHELYKPGERVVIFDVFESQGQAVWTHKAPPFDAGELDAFRTGKPHGVWVLCNPISGEFLPNDNGNPSRRSWQTVTSWRYMVLESDKADAAHWLAVLAQMPLPISAIYSSGGKSIHALVRLDAESKAHWDALANEIKPALVTLGADRKALSAVRLTRLPGCERVETGRRQELLFLNGKTDGTPICEMPVIAPGWKDWLPGDQDGFNAEASNE